jgi:hypothetical protein
MSVKGILNGYARATPILNGGCLPLGTTIAADFDGSKPLICAPSEAVEVLAGEEIVKARPSDIGAPSFLRVDIADEKIAGPQRVTPIRNLSLEYWPETEIGRRGQNGFPAGASCCR